MRQTLWTTSAALIAAGIMMVQATAGQQPPAQTKGSAKGPAAKAAPSGPVQSPASRPKPKTAIEQTYPKEQVALGEKRFISECGFCHGRDAEGGESDSDLTQSELVAADVRGDKILPLLAAGRADRGMPAFKLSTTDQTAIVAFIHDRKTKSDAEGGGRGRVEGADLVGGDVEAGKKYFNGAGGCSTCHSPTSDLAGVATRHTGLELIQRMLYPTVGRPAPARPKGTVTLASGQVVTGQVATDDEFNIVLLDAAGARQSYDKTLVKYKIDDPMSAHFDQLAKYTDIDIHNMFAYLDTLK